MQTAPEKRPPALEALEEIVRPWSVFRPPFRFFLAELHHFLPDRHADDEKDQAYYQEQEEQKLCDARGGRSDSGEPEERRDQRDNQESKSPL